MTPCHVRQRAYEQRRKRAERNHDGLTLSDFVGAVDEEADPAVISDEVTSLTRPTLSPDG